jgi:hypothetical protein
MFLSWEISQGHGIFQTKEYFINRNSSKEEIFILQIANIRIIRNVLVKLKTVHKHACSRKKGKVNFLLEKNCFPDRQFTSE